MNKEKCLDNLYDAIISASTLKCSKCNDEQSLYHTDERAASNVFYANGWRATSINVCCPVCSKKYLKGK